MTIWWLSFALDDGRTNYCCIVEEESFGKALSKATKLGINPGGECLGFPIPPGEIEASLPRDRWLTREELEAAGIKRLGDVDGSN